MRKLLETIDGYSCKVYAVTGTRRIRVGAATPKIEFYEDITVPSVLGSQGIQSKKAHFSIVLCPDPEMSRELDAETFKRLSSFDLTVEIPRESDNLIIPVNIFDVCEAELNDNEWRFAVTNPVVIEELKEARYGKK